MPPRRYFKAKVVLLKDGACMSVSSSLDDSLIHVGRLLRNFITTSCLWFIFFVSSTKMCVAEPMYFFSAGVMSCRFIGVMAHIFTGSSELTS